MPTVDLDRLADLTADLECGHPIEAVLRSYGIHPRWSAYDVVVRQQKNREYLEKAVSPDFKTAWKNAVNELAPCIVAIAKHFEEHHDS